MYSHGHRRTPPSLAGSVGVRGSSPLSSTPIFPSQRLKFLGSDAFHQGQMKRWCPPHVRSPGGPSSGDDARDRQTADASLAIDAVGLVPASSEAVGGSPGDLVARR